MKKVKTALLAALFIVLLAVPASAATLLYAPGHVAVQATAGSPVVMPVELSIIGALDTFQVEFISQAFGNAAPWISFATRSAVLTSRAPAARGMMVVNVPEGAVGGAYFAHIIPGGFARSGPAMSGPGLIVEIMVAAQGCQEAPTVEITGFGPDFIWPPNGKEKNISVSGMIALPEGCSLSGAGFTLTDEYGIIDTVAAITADQAGYFNLQVPVEALREGSDKDGRTYSITVFASDEAGIGASVTLKAVVPHDMKVKK